MTKQEALIYFKRRQAMYIDDRIQEAENIAIECIEKCIREESKKHCWKLLDAENYATCKKYSHCIFRIDNQLIAVGHIASDKTIRLDEGHEIDIVMATFCKKIEFIYTAELIEK